MSDFSVQPLCSLCLCGGFPVRVVNHRDTENTKVAQRKRFKIGGQPHVILLALLSACVMLAWSPDAFALNPKLDVSQYAHTSWHAREGFPRGLISSIAQTPDGYLWLGTEF